MLTPKDRLVQTTGVRSVIFEIMISVQFLLQHLEDTICALFDSIKMIELKSCWTDRTEVMLNNKSNWTEKRTINANLRLLSDHDQIHAIRSWSNYKLWSHF